LVVFPGGFGMVCCVVEVPRPIEEEVSLSTKISQKIAAETSRISEEIATEILKDAKLSSFTLAIREQMLKLGANITETALEHLQNNVPHESTSGLRSKGERQRTIKTVLGDVSYSRQAFYSPERSALSFPADSLIGVQPGQLQPDVLSACVKLGIEMPFADASEIYHSLTGLTVSEGAVHDATVEAGAFAGFVDVIPTEEEISAKIDLLAKKDPKGKVHLVLSADGAMEPLRPEESKRKGNRGEHFWKECKGFRLFAIAGPGRIAHLASWHQIGDAQDLGKSLQGIATLIERRKEELVVVADGAKWIWAKAAETLPTSRIEVLDWYHVVEYLSAFAGIHFAAASDHKNAWLSKMKTFLMSDKVDAVIADIKEKSASNEKSTAFGIKAVGYLENNKERMKYGTLSKKGLTIGSGGMEAANKSVSHTRLKRSGCWWKESHANEILRLRCAKVNGTLERLLANCWVARSKAVKTVKQTS
jgi:hypothetical protein